MDYFNHQHCKMFISSIFKRFFTCDNSDPESFLAKGPKRHFWEALSPLCFCRNKDTHINI